VEPQGTPIQGVFADSTEGIVHLEPEYVDGLRDLDGFSHAILIYHFHKSEEERIIGQPYLERKEHGIFSIRSPHRPNHIGLSVVRIKSIDGGEVRFSEVDILDGTPILDIKPYVRQFDSRDNAVSGWMEKHFQEGDSPPVVTVERF
jgi:tRNA-Thr(GGU) m(6)t(6)A37 methyltransferase TsaA